MRKNDKLIIKATYNIKHNSTTKLYNYLKFGKPINTKLTEKILKRRSRSYSRTKFLIKINFCTKCFKFKKVERHHLDYKEPDKIVILCRKCHFKLYHTK